MSLTLVPALLEHVWRRYATHPIGLQPTPLPARGVDRLTGLTLERRVAIEATR